MERREVREKTQYIIRVMLPRFRGSFLVCLVAAAVTASACAGGGIFGKDYEYEEDLFLNLDGSATIIVNASVPALVALRGLDLNTDPDARVDREKVRAAYTTPVAEIARVSREWRRQGRRFIQVRLDVPDIRKLSEAAPFSWSSYELVDAGGEHVFRQRIGAPDFKPGTLQDVGWTGQEIVAFRLHLPSRIRYHNSRDLDTNETLDPERGNILRWEQHLADRLDGVPINVEVRMESQSILYRTLWLFGGAFFGAVALLAVLIWLMFRKGGRGATAQTP